MIPTRKHLERFWAVTKFGRSCWVFQTLHPLGYGVISMRGKIYYAHRLSHMWFRGPIPKKFEVHHSCENKACVNPDHLEALSRTDHVQTFLHKNPQTIKTHCPKGHPYSGDNLKVVKRSNGWKNRICIACTRTRRHDKWIEFKKNRDCKNT
jgi:hypothetical protein